MSVDLSKQSVFICQGLEARMLRKACTHKHTPFVWLVWILCLRLLPLHSFTTTTPFCLSSLIFFNLFSFHQFPSFALNPSSFPQPFILGCILLPCPWEPELEVGVIFVLFVHFPQFSLGTTRWYPLFLTLILLGSMLIFSLSAWQKKKSQPGCPGVKQRWKVKACNWGPREGRIPCMSRRIIASGADKVCLLKMS